jgi:hypothetical protein
LGETLFDASDLAMVGASFVKRPFGGKVETVLTPATHRLLPRLFVLGFWARELDCFLLGLFVAGMRLWAVSWNQAASEMRIVEEM